MTNPIQFSFDDLNEITFDEILEWQQKGQSLGNEKFFHWLLCRIYIFYRTKYGGIRQNIHPKYFNMQRKYIIPLRNESSNEDEDYENQYEENEDEDYENQYEHEEDEMEYHEEEKNNEVKNKLYLRITEGMELFFEDFVYRQLAKVTKTEQKKLEVLQEEISEIKLPEKESEQLTEEEKKEYDAILNPLEEEKKLIDDAIKTKIYELVGLRDMMIIANNDIHQLHGLMKNSMVQLTRDLDVENVVAHREYRRLRRWVKGGKPDTKVVKLYNSAKQKFKIEWDYLEGETCFQIYIDGEKIDNPKKYENINGAIDAANKVKRAPFLEEHNQTPENWHPYETEQSVELILVIGKALGGKVGLYDLKIVLDEILKKANIGGEGYLRDTEGNLQKAERDVTSLGFDDVEGEEVMDYINQKQDSIDAGREEQEKNYEENKKYYNIATNLILEYEKKDPKLLKRFRTFLKKIHEAMKNEVKNNEVDVLHIDVIELIKDIFSEDTVYKEFIDDFEYIREENEINEFFLISALQDTLDSYDEDYQKPVNQEGKD